MKSKFARVLLCAAFLAMLFLPGLIWPLVSKSL